VSAQIPVALTIAGSDCSAGAGAQADLKTFSACGVYGLTALTCVVAETPGRVLRIDPIDPAMVVAQVHLLLEEFPVGAVKTGMLYSGEIVSRVAATLRSREVPVVVDPVMVATSGDLLLQQDAIDVYERELFPLAAVITPNLDEAATLLGEPIPDVAAMHSAGRRLLEKYEVPVLLKGGHLRGNTALDLLFTRDGNVAEFSAPFSPGVQTHGTGCTYAAAIAAKLACGFQLGDAVGEAKQFVTRAIAQHFQSPLPSGKSIHALNHSAARR
jgi:hydroxymethylpyrimidine/phosphomethylpyrimidine kinase